MIVCKNLIIQVLNEVFWFLHSVSNLAEPYAAPGGFQPGAACLRGPYLCGEVDPGSATLAQNPVAINLRLVRISVLSLKSTLSQLAG